jgi:hypothetical protein
MMTARALRTTFLGKGMVCLVALLQLLGPLLNSHFDGHGWEDEPSRVSRAAFDAPLVVHGAQAPGLRAAAVQAADADSAPDAASGVADAAPQAQALEYTRFVDAGAAPPPTLLRPALQTQGSPVPGRPPALDTDEDEGAGGVEPRWLAGRARSLLDDGDDDERTPVPGDGADAPRAIAYYALPPPAPPREVGGAGLAARLADGGRAAAFRADDARARLARCPPTGPPRAASALTA